MSMIAKTFLQYASTLSYYKRLVKSNDGGFGIPTTHESLCEFYAQPFAPDLIPSLFHNFEFKADKIYGIRQDKWIEVRPFKGEYSIAGSPFVPYSTLDHFIGDCQRFRVELVWNDDVVEKYFL